MGRPGKESGRGLNPGGQVLRPPAISAAAVPARAGAKCGAGRRERSLVTSLTNVVSLPGPAGSDVRPQTRDEPDACTSPVES